MIHATITRDGDSDAPDPRSLASSALHRLGALGSPVITIGETAIGLRALAKGWQVVAWAPSGELLPLGLQGDTTEFADGLLLVGEGDAHNAAGLRSLIPWLRPRPIVGGGASFGFGDRLGLATPGHVQALRDNPGIAPVLAQQSARELGRTGRTFQNVLDAATFGALASGWTSGYGADADHLKSTADIDAGLQAGFTMFTADPIAVVPDLRADAHHELVRRAFERVPWALLEDDEAAFKARYPEVLDADGVSVPLSRDRLVAAAARFGEAVAHVATMYRHLLATVGDRAVDFEVAVDEIAHATTAVDHVYIATELRRLGVRWVSFAPRFIGQFEKGIDYLGDRGAFEEEVTLHAALARSLGPYKLSVHSGSDKFSIYPALARESRRAVHLKTSGTSYLEALRTIAAFEPDLLRRIWRVALEAYTASRSSYWVSATLEDLPGPERRSDTNVASLLETPNTREILHVTFGAIIARRHADTVIAQEASLADELLTTLWSHHDAYWSRLATHLGRHLEPFGAHASPEKEAATWT